METITLILIIVIVTIVVRYAFSFSKKKAPVSHDGTMILKYPFLIALIGYFSIIFGVLIGVVTVLQLVKTTGNEAVPFLVSFFVLLGLPLVLMQARTRALVTDDKIRFTGILNRVKEIRWDAIEQVSFNFMSELVLKTKDTAIKLNMMLAGFNDFTAMIKQKLDPSLYGAALERLGKAHRNMDKRGR